MKHVTRLRFVIQRWRELAMRNGYTDHRTEIEAEPVDGGYLPAFVGKYNTRVIVEMATPATHGESRT